MFLFSRPPWLSVPALVLGAVSLAHPQLAHAQVPVSSSVAATNKAELVNRVQEFHATDIWPSKLVSTVNWKLSAPAWAAMLDKKGVETAARVGRGMGSYIKEQGIGDLEQVETSNNNDRKSTQGDVDELIGEAKPKIGLSIEATQAKLSPTQTRIFLSYVSFMGQFLNRGGWTPRGGRANLKLIVSSSAKEVAVTASKDATNFTIIAPLKEPLDWSSKIEKAMNRYAK